MKVKPICPGCKTEGNMDGTMDGSIFCGTCGWCGTSEQIWKFMQDTAAAGASTKTE